MLWTLARVWSKNLAGNWLQVFITGSSYCLSTPSKHIFFMILFFQSCPLLTGTLIFPINKLSYIHHSKTDPLSFFLELKPRHTVSWPFDWGGDHKFFEDLRNLALNSVLTSRLCPVHKLEHGSLAVLITFINSTMLYLSTFYYHLMKPPPASISNAPQTHWGFGNPWAQTYSLTWLHSSQEIFTSKSLSHPLFQSIFNHIFPWISCNKRRICLCGKHCRLLPCGILTSPTDSSHLGLILTHWGWYLLIEADTQPLWQLSLLVAKRPRYLIKGNVRKNFKCFLNW